MKNIFLVLALIVFVGCTTDELDEIKKCQCEIDLTIEDLRYEENGIYVTKPFYTLTMDSGELSCEEYFNNPPTRATFVDTYDFITETFEIDLRDYPEFTILNARCIE